MGLEKAYELYKKLKLTEKTAHQPDVNEDAPMTAWKNRLFGEQLEKAGKQFKEELDYIFCEEEKWQVIRVLKVPHRDDIEECKMPGWKYPSDHFMIMAELALKLSPLDAWKKRNKECEVEKQELKTARARLRKQPAEEVLRTRRLADTGRMEAKDVTAMSPSELVLHRRRLATEFASRPFSPPLWNRSRRLSATTRN